MKKRRLKKGVLPALYVMIALFAMGGTYLVESMFTKDTFNDSNNYGKVSDVDKNNNVEKPVVNTEETIIKPFTDTDVKEVKSYYDYKGDESSQENSIILYNNKYMQNTGIAYGGKSADESFDVVSILNGKVIEVKEDKLLGNIVQIKHDNDVISVYQSLSDVTVKKGDDVKRGQVIAKSGTCNISTDLGNHLLFELIVKGSIVNPDDYYDKLVTEI